MEQQTANTDASSASSAAPVSAQSVLDSLSHTERESYQLSGELPERITVGSPADSSSDVNADPSPAPPDKAAATAASDSAASEPATPAKKEKGAKARTAELDAEIAGLQDRLKLRAALREELARVDPPKTSTAASSPATAPTLAEYERFLAMPGAPKEEDFDSYAKFSAAQSLFITDQRWQEHQTRTREDVSFSQTVDTVRQMGESAQQRVTEFAKGDPDFASKVNPQLLDLDTATVRRLRGESVGQQHVLAEEIAKSEQVGPLLLHFSTPEGQAEWGRLVRLSEPDLLRAFGRLEARFDGVQTPPPNHVSKAPTPPTVLGQQQADSSDPVDAAIKRKDGAAYMREQNKRDLAAMGL